MKSSTLLVILAVLVEGLIIGGAAFSIMQIRSGAWDAGTQPDEVIKRIGTVAGILVPVFGALMISLIMVARAKEK